MSKNTEITTGMIHNPTQHFLNTTLCVLTKKYSTIGCGASIIYLIWPTLLSNLTATNKVDSDVDIDYDSQSFVTTRKNNHSFTELRDTDTTMSQVWLECNPQ